MMSEHREVTADYAAAIQHVYGSAFLLCCVIEWSGIGYRCTLPSILPTAEWPEPRYSMDDWRGSQTEEQMRARTDELRRVGNRLNMLEREKPNDS